MADRIAILSSILVALALALAAIVGFRTRRVLPAMLVGWAVLVFVFGVQVWLGLHLSHVNSMRMISRAPDDPEIMAILKSLPEGHHLLPIIMFGWIDSMVFGALGKIVRNRIEGRQSALHSRFANETKPDNLD